VPTAALFVSDLHLAPERPAVTRAFLDFLGGAEAPVLYILGDLFEAWVGDDDDSPLAQSVMGALAAASARGIRLHFLAGNRDFSVGQRFARRTGAHLLGDQESVSIAGRNLLLLHGDTLCTDDAAYQRFRRRIRNPWVLGLLRRLPLAARRRIAQRWREASARHNSNKPEYIMDVNERAVTEAFRTSQAELMIHGHTHRPGRHRYRIDGRERERVVLGDWTDVQGWYAHLEDSGSLELRPLAL
jgi:UDP-2,3-diacylglucosamine hydrolase